MGWNSDPKRTKFPKDDNVSDIRCLFIIGMDVSENSGTQKWMVYNGKTLLKWMIWGYHYFWKHPYIWRCCHFDHSPTPWRRVFFARRSSSTLKLGAFCLDMPPALQPKMHAASCSRRPGWMSGWRVCWKMLPCFVASVPGKRCNI